jgi:hypothetical protein
MPKIVPYLDGSYTLETTLTEDQVQRVDALPRNINILGGYYESDGVPRYHFFEGDEPSAKEDIENLILKLYRYMPDLKGDAWVHGLDGNQQYSSRLYVEDNCLYEERTDYVKEPPVLVTLDTLHVHNYTDTPHSYKGQYILPQPLEQKVRDQLLLEVPSLWEVTEDSVKVARTGNDYDRYYVKELMKVAQILRNAIGVVECGYQLEDEHPFFRFEYYSIQDGKLYIENTRQHRLDTVFICKING